MATPLKKTKIVLTGAPSSGKSTTLQALQKHFGDKVVLVPESAVVLLSGGFPAPSHNDNEQIRAFQKAILSVQENLEDIFSRKSSAPVMILDRAKLDGAGFWPPGPEDYFKNFNVDYQHELNSYEHVLFMELPKPEHFGGLAQTRFHNYEQSLQSEKALEQVWGKHKSFTKILAQADLNKKIDNVIQVIEQLIK